MNSEPEYTVELVVSNGGHLKYTALSPNLRAREINLVFIRLFTCAESSSLSENIEEDDSYKTTVYLTIKVVEDDKETESSMMFPETHNHPTMVYLVSANLVWEAVKNIKEGFIPGLETDSESEADANC